MTNQDVLDRMLDEDFDEIDDAPMAPGLRLRALWPVVAIAGAAFYALLR